MVDVLFGFAVFAVVAIAVGADVNDPGTPEARDGPFFLLGLVIAVLLGVLMLWRRHRPVTVLVATAVLVVTNYVLDLPIIGLAVPLAPALYSAAEAGRARWALGTATTLLVLSTTVRLVQGQDPGFVLGYELASTVAIMGAAIALGHIRVQRKEAERQRERIAELDRGRLEAEAAERISRERTRIARDLHDAVGHQLTVVTLHSAVASEALQGQAPDLEAVRTELGYVTEYSRAGLRDLRATVRALREADPGEERGASLAYLDELVEKVRTTGLEVRVTNPPRPGEVPGMVGATAYRIVQEALTNTLKHAGASRADVEFDRRGEDLNVVITDDGTAGEGPVERGSGLAGMGERVRLVGGTVHSGPREDAGFEVRACLPCGGAR